MCIEAYSCVGGVCVVCVVCCVCLVCENVLAVDVGEILVSIVVSIPACHAGDPGSIPGREAFAHCSLLIAHCYRLLLALWSVLSALCSLLCWCLRLASFHTLQ